MDFLVRNPHKSRAGASLLEATVFKKLKPFSFFNNWMLIILLFGVYLLFFLKIRLGIWGIKYFICKRF